LQPSTVVALGELVQAAGAGFVGCPVIGTIPQVLQGELLVLAGGAPESVERAKDALRPLAREVVCLGPLGAGNVMKLVLNLTMASYLEALAEGLALGGEYGFELDQMLDLLAQSPTANPWLTAKREMLAGGSGPVSLDLSAIHKDVLYAVAAGSSAGVSMPMASGILSSLSAALAAGHGQEDLAMLPRVFRKTMLRRVAKHA
jgi:3-hydroxyisobutyrate dehydrogenase